jgi:hypothetical protein
MVIGGTIQIVFAICLTILLFIIGFATYNFEFMKAIQNSSNSALQKAVPIFEGIKDYKNVSTEMYTVTDKKDPSYRDIQPSYNQKGGAEFSYSFWLFNDHIRTDTIPNERDKGFDNTKQIILFVKGSKKIFTYKNICKEDKSDIKIKCPLVKLENNNTNLTVEFNTLNYPDAIKQNLQNNCNKIFDNWKKTNSHKLTIGNLDRNEFKGKWVLVTIIIKDTVPSDSLPYRNKTHCEIYLNNFKELDTYVDGGFYTDKKTNISSIKTNQGPLYVFPEKVDVSTPTTTKKLMIANLTYYNYSLDQNNIENIYNAGVPKYTAASVGSNATYNDVVEVSNMYSESLTDDDELARRTRPSAN